MKCDRCGYVLQSFEDECPRCKHRAEQKCAICNHQGIVGRCPNCRKMLCAECLPAAGGLCVTCAPEQYTSPQPQAPSKPPLPYSADLDTFSRAPEVFMQRASYSTDFFTSVSRAFTFIGQSMRIAFRDKDMLLPSLFAFLTNGAIVAAFLLVAHYTGHLQELFEGNQAYGPDIPRFLLFAGLGFVCYLVTYFFMGMTVNLVNSRLRGRDAKLGEAFADALKNALALIYLAVATLIVTSIARALRRRGGLAGKAAGWAIERTWMVATYLLVPIIILEDISFGGALDRAKNLHSGNFVPIAVGEIGISIVNGAMIFLVILIFGGIGAFLSVAGHGALLIATLAIGGLFFIATICFTEFVRTSYYTCLYLWAAERERVGDAARIPTPLAAALAR